MSTDIRGSTENSLEDSLGLGVSKTSTRVTAFGARHFPCKKALEAKSILSDPIREATMSTEESEARRYCLQNCLKDPIEDCPGYEPIDQNRPY